ncbi:MAG: amino acid adenylation domain-containing protein [Candidatus Omnitrophota bacterium]
MHVSDSSDFEKLWVAAGKKVKEKKYWIETLSGELTKSRFPYSDKNPPTEAPDTDSIPIPIAQPISSRLMQLSAGSDIRLHIILSAVLTLLLSKYTGNEDIIMGTPVSHGAHGEHGEKRKEGGAVINTVLALRHQLNGDMSFKELLFQSRQTIIDANENQNYPFEVLVRQLEIPFLEEECPLFDVGLVLENIQDGAHLSTINPKVVFSFLRVEAHVQSKIIYNTHVYHRQMIERIALHFCHLLKIILSDPDKKIAEIEMITEDEKKQILDDFNRTAAEYPDDKTIHGLFDEQVVKTPDHIALIGFTSVGALREAPPSQISNWTIRESPLHITYKQLNERSNRLASEFIRKGVQPNTIVGIKIERSIEMIIGIFGILKAGGAYLPISPDYPEARANYMMKDSRALFLVTHSVGADSCVCPSASCLPSTGNRQPATSLAYVIYTSGSTGNPKGVMVDHASVINLLYAMQKKYPLKQSDTYLLKTSYVFDVSVTELFGWFMEGGRSTILEKGGEKDPRVILDTIERNGVSHINFVPSMFNAFIGYLDMENKRQIESLKYIFLAGEALLPELVNKFNDLNTAIALENLYGPTESTVYASWYSLGRERTGSIPIGRPLPNIKLYIVDKYHHLQPTGIAGELYISGNGLARGYLNRPELTAERFNRNVISHLSLVNGKRDVTNDHCPMTNDYFYKTGDLCRWRGDGNIEFLGRIDQQVKIRGFRIELEEIENRLLSHENVKEAVVVVKEDRGDKYLAAFIVSDMELSIPELRAYLLKNLPDYMVPSYFMRLNALPLTVTGKIDRKSLPVLEMKGNQRYIAPGNAIEEKLAELWSEILGRKKELIGIGDNFFELGGHSLKATILISKIYKLFHVNMPLGEIFKNSTIRGLFNYISNYIKKSVKERYVSIERVEEKEYYPLSSVQKRLYVLHQMDKKGINYNITSFFLVEGEIDQPKLEETFKRLIDRHESFRTSFHPINEEPVQRIHTGVEFTIDFLTVLTEDTGGEGKKVRNEEGETVSVGSVVENFIKFFDLSKAPLMRVGLIEIEESRHLLAVDMHHIVSDGTSMNIVVHDFMALYQGEDLPELQIHYKDFSEWNNKINQTELLKYQEKFWLNEFEGEIPVLGIPVDYSRPAIQSFEGRCIHFELDQEITGLLKTSTLETETTLYMMLLALYNVFLSKVSNQDDIVIGSPIAGRRHADLDKIIGMFVNTLAIRSYPLGEKTFTGFLHEVKEKTLHVFENQDYPYEDLVERVVVNWDTGRNPLFDTMFVLQNAVMQSLAIPGLMLTPYEYENHVSKFDLTLSVVEEDDRLCLTFEYSTKLFKRGTIERFISYFKNIVKGVIENSDHPLSDFEIITEEEKNRILYDFNDTAAEYPKEKTIHQLFEAQVEKAPSHIALIGQTSVGADPRVCPQLSYAELNERSNRFACELIRNGVKPDTIVGIMLERSIEMIIGIFGILKAGGTYLPISPDYPEERANYMMKDSRALLLVTHTVGADPCVCPGAFNLPLPSVASVFSVRNSNLAYIIYTSGSTGRPKGTLIEHRSVVNRLNWMQKAYPIGPTDIILQKTPVVFDVSVWELFWWSFYGARLCLLQARGEKNPETIAAAISTYGVTTIHFVPSMLSVFLIHLESLKNGEAEQATLRSLKYVFASGEALGVEHVDRFYRLLMSCNEFPRLINLYGPTEATVDVSFFECAPQAERIPIGKPIDNIALLVLDREWHLQPVGVSGELYIGGIGVARGYLNQPELTFQTFVNKRFCGSFFKKGIASPVRVYRTGDLCRWLDDGNIEFLGRMDHQVKIRGFRIELGEIQSRLLKFQGIREVAVLARKGNDGNVYLCAYIVSNQPYEIAELREFLSQGLPDYMIPSFFVALERIPLTGNGKLDRNALPEPELKSGKGYTGPRDDLERELIRIWHMVLNQPADAIGIDDHFFELGGHSLKATVMVFRIHQVLNVQVPLDEMFKRPTIRRLAQYIRETVPEAFESIEQVEEKEYYELSSAQKRLYFIHVMEPDSVAYNLPVFWAFDDGIDPALLTDIFKKLLIRHDMLRTSFRMLGEVPVQRIQDIMDFKIVYYDYFDAEHDDAEHKIKRIRKLTSDFIRPFDLSHAPLLRVAVIKDGKRSILLVDMHHIVTDGVSQDMLMREFIALYSGKELSKELPPLKLQYKDFSEWQKRPYYTERLKKQEDYWLGRFRGEIPVLNLPTNYPRPPIQRLDGHTVSREIETGLAKRLRALASEQGATLYMILLAIYTVLLAKYANQSDIIVGSPVAGRRDAGLEGIVGMFVNVLLMRNTVEPKRGFDEFLEAVKFNTLQAFENQDYSIDQLAGKLDIPRDAGRNPLYEVIFALTTVDARHMTRSDPELKPFEDFKEPIKTDLRLGVTDDGDRLTMALTYSVALFNPQTAENMLRHYQEIIAHIVENKKKKIEDIQISQHITMLKSNVLREEESEFDI